MTSYHFDDEQFETIAEAFDEGHYELILADDGFIKYKCNDSDTLVVLEVGESDITVRTSETEMPDFVAAEERFTDLDDAIEWATNFT